MRRYHVGEIADKTWFPCVFRDLMTDTLQFAIVRFRIYEPVIPLICEVLMHMKITRIIDLCSGGSGPWSQLQPQLQEQMGSVSVILTDKYPNIRAFEKTTSYSGSTIQYISTAVDAMNVPVYLKGMRTIFSAFHHFEPDAARKILQNAADQRSAIAIFELTERHFNKLLLCLLVPAIVFLSTPFIRPVIFKRMLWVYIIPVIPLVLACDAVISYLKSYSSEDLNQLVKSVNAQGYVWKIGQAVPKMRGVKITYLLGFPRSPGLFPEGSAYENSFALGK